MTEHLIIDGNKAAASDGQTFDVYDPSSGDALATVAKATKTDVDRAVNAAHNALESNAWGGAPPAERGRVMIRIAQTLRERAEELATLESRDNGKPLKQARTDVQVAARYFEFFAGIADKIMGNTIPLGPGFLDYTVREPIGVSAQIIPWNYPIQIGARGVAPALAAGCAVILKPSEQTPLHAFAVAECAAAAGLPPGVFNLVTGTGPVAGEALAAHPHVDHVSLTGSTAAGRRVAALAAPTLKRLTLELGGKSANVVLDDADLDAAVRRGVEQCYWNSGQNCMAWSRMLVPRALQEEVAERVREVVRAQRVGPPSDPATTIGPLISAAQAERVRALVREAPAQGARLVCGGARRPERFARGFYVQPTVFCDVDNAMTIAREEVFGPVLGILPYDDEQQAVAVANDTPFGLHGAVFSGDPARGIALARQLRTGMVDVNGAPLNAQAPFGGRGQSGLGRELGTFGLDEYVELKSIQRPAISHT
jgi:acyl-CoA reductase-like NAD-dependent aldehyde dehydrogenase